MNELELEVGLMADESLRVIAMGYKFITNDETNDYLEFGMILGLLDKERLEAKKAVLEAKKAHIKTIMITGDSLKTACAIAKRLDILKDDNEAISAYDLKKLPDESIDLIVTDPPYNLNKDYGKSKDNLEFEEYLDFSRAWLSEAKRVLKKEGSIYIFMGMRYISYIYEILEKDLGMYFNSWITWHYTQGIGKTKGFSPRHDDILLFTKNEKKCHYNRY